MYLCTLKQREYSSVGLEHLPYKQRVIGSNPITPTEKKSDCKDAIAFLFYIFFKIYNSFFEYLFDFPDFNDSFLRQRN